METQDQTVTKIYDEHGNLVKIVVDVSSTLKGVGGMG